MLALTVCIFSNLCPSLLSTEPCNEGHVQSIIHVSVNNACDGAFDETYLQALSILTVSSDMQILHAQYLLKDILVAHSVDLWLSFYIGKKFKVMKISGALFILVTGIQEDSFKCFGFPTYKLPSTPISVMRTEIVRAKC